MRPTRLRSTAREARHRYGARIELALRTAVAAGIAWWLAIHLPGVTRDVAGYAPLGAVIGTSTTVVDSLRGAMRAVLGVLMGSAVALAVMAVLPLGVAALALAVLLGVLVASHRLLGAQSSWVVIAAVFVLLLGARDPDAFVEAYAGLVLLGGAVAVAIGAAVPPLPLHRGRDALRRWESALADELDELADRLRRDADPGLPELAASAGRGALAELRAQADHVQESRRGNLRVRRHDDEARRQVHWARALDRCAVLVDDLAMLLAEVQGRSGRMPLDEEVRSATADALTELAALVRVTGVDDEDAADAVLETGRSADALEDLLRDGRHGSDQVVASAVLLAVRRCLRALQPVDEPLLVTSGRLGR